MLKIIFLTIIIIFFPKNVFSDEIVIGIDADMSAFAAIGGEAIYRGAKIAVNEINNKGGVLGRNLILKVKDHRGNPRRGIENIKDFSKDKNLVAVLGGVHTPVAINELEQIHKNKIIYLGPWAAGTSIVDNGYEPNYVFRLSVRDEYAGEVFIKYAKAKGFKNISLLLERTAWGKSNFRSLSLAADKQGIKISCVEWFNWGSDNFHRQLKKINKVEAEAVIFVGNAPEGAVFVKKMATLAIDERLPIISHWGIAGGDFVNKVGLNNLSNVDVAVLQTYSFAKPKNFEKASYVLSQYRKLFFAEANANNVPAVTGMVHAYDLVNILTIAIEKAKSIDREKVQKKLEEINNYDGLARFFSQPFSNGNHDALSGNDYIFSSFDKHGFLIPIKF